MTFNIDEVSALEFGEGLFAWQPLGDKEENTSPALLHLSARLIAVIKAQHLIDLEGSRPKNFSQIVDTSTRGGRGEGAILFFPLNFNFLINLVSEVWVFTGDLICTSECQQRSASLYYVYYLYIITAPDPSRPRMNNIHKSYVRGEAVVFVDLFTFIP